MFLLEDGAGRSLLALKSFGYHKTGNDDDSSFGASVKRGTNAQL
jgi:hypothetical protein